MKRSLISWSTGCKPRAIAALSVLLALPLPGAAPEQVSTVVAKVGDEVITSIELDRFVNPHVRQLAQVYDQDELYTQTVRARQSGLRQLIERKLLVAEAKALQLEMPDVEVERKMDEIRSRFATDEDFRAWLDEARLTLEELKSLVGDDLKARALMQEKVVKKVVVLPTEVHDYYQLHVSEFLQPAQVHLYQILIKKAPDYTNGMLRAQAILEEVKTGGNFQQIARLKSEGPKREKGGDWGMVEEGTFGDEMAVVEKAAFRLNPGECSEIIETKYGFHIVSIDKKRISRILSERDAYDDIRQKLFEQRFAKVYDEYMTHLRSKTYVEVLDAQAQEPFTIGTTPSALAPPPGAAPPK